MKQIIKYYEELLEYLEYHNSMAPFPVYDTEYVEMVREKLKEIMITNEFDDAPVIACRHCNDLFIVVDEVENDVCMRCGAINELRIFQDIFEYLKEVGHSEDN